ncbi:class I SAM-dependent methyltransferase [Kineosporia babensis]
MESEFGAVAAWTADAVRILGPEYAVPAACQGSADPLMLEWLARECRLAQRTVLLDVGGGMGGPATFAAREYGARPVVLEPMIAACRAAADLFGLKALACEGSRLPVADESADAVWCLGVLCTTPDKTELLEEIARVMKPAARLGLLAFVSDQPRPPGAPEGNDFPSETELPGLLEKTGLEVTALVDPPESADHAWQRRADEATALIGQLHAGDPRLDEARDQQQRIKKLIGDGVVRAKLLSARRF